MNSILCADIGTTSLKVGIISDAGDVVSFCTQSLNTENSSYIANQWIQAFINGALECLKSESGSATGSATGSLRNSIRGICISGNGPTVVSQNGRTLLWNSPLAGRIADSLPQTRSLFLPQLAAFRHFFPEEWNNSEKILSGPEFLIYKLTGRAVTILPEARYTEAYWNEESIKQFNIESEKLPDFVPVSYNAGNLEPHFAGQLNLPQTVPVFCGGPDFVTAIIGTNNLQSGKLCDRSGSSEGLNFCVEKPLFAPGLRTLPHVIPGLWNISALIPESGSLISQYKNEISSLEGIDVKWDEIIEYSFNDHNSEGWRILNEIAEKNANGLRLLKNLAAENGIQFPSTMTITGGQAKNGKWLKKKAEDTGTDISICNTPDAELTGDGIIGFTGLGYFNNLLDAAEKMVHITKTYSSRPDFTKELRICRIPLNLKTIIFDIDSTLYTSERYAFEQVDCQIRHWAKQKGITPAQARNKISEYRKNWSKENDGKKISLGNTFINFGVSIEDSVKMRRTLLEPKEFLNRDEKLIETLTKLKTRFNLICVTNNPVLPARKTLAAIGIDKIIPDIIGLDTCGKSKPAHEPFELACRITRSRPEECLSVGDRYDLDIALPLEMGMGGIVVTGVSDVYKLPEILKI